MAKAASGQPPISGPRPVRAPRGNTLTCKNWLIEAAYRMLQNNLDPDVAERPQDLVVYGGLGKAARNWESYDAILAALRNLNADETLLVQSGKPVAVLRTHADAPRVLLANSNLVPKWATWEHFHELDRKGLMMYGQMTAGSWIYIGTQGIVQGTYETFVELGRQHYGGDWAGKWILTAGLGGMGGAQPLAATLAVLTVDLLVFARRPHEPSTRECVIALTVYIGLAVAFGLWVWHFHGSQYGLEFYAGIPGTVGGALTMNAGCYGSETKDILVSAWGLTRAGKRTDYALADFGYTYRHSEAPADITWIEATYRGTPADPATVQAKIDEITSRREQTQPIREKTGGSTFKNPPGHSSWKLVDDAGWRGKLYQAPAPQGGGGAMFSELHSNFMINPGEATAADIEGLGDTVRADVLAKTGVQLDWEIKRIGRGG